LKVEAIVHFVKAGMLERWNVDSGRCKMQDRQWLTGDRGRETGEKLFGVHDGDPPFVGKDDADASIP
jgi:hypothetical protein